MSRHRQREASQARDTSTHRKGVILYEWVDRRGHGCMSAWELDGDPEGQLDERLDRISRLERLSHESIKGLIFPFRGRLKKLKINGRVALRPILVLGPSDKQHEVTFLLPATERDRKLIPSERDAERIASERLSEIVDDPDRRKRYERT